jgi:RNA polymerase sigma factor (sigma-70 family)
MHLSIINGCQKEDAAMQRALFRQYAPLMMTVCRRYARHQAEAEDMLQEAFIKVFRNIDRYDPAKGAFNPWIRRIVVNTAIQYWRKERRNIWVQPDADLPDIPEDEAPFHLLSEEEILQLIAQLPEGFRMVFNLYALDGYSHAEVAQALGITESSSRSQLTRARRWLKNAISALKLETDERF